MGFYDVEKNCDAYTEMAVGYDGLFLIKRLRELLPEGRVLELGMGPGVDLQTLSKTYNAVGSDASEIFVRRYQEKHPDSDVRVIDILNIDSEETFDGIYSCKVLHHVYPDELTRSLEQQLAILRSGGIAAHAMWHGSPRTDEGHGLLFTYYDEETLRAHVPAGYEIVETVLYTELESDDSLTLVLRKI